MKHIQKGIEPQELSLRRARLRSTPDIGDAWYDQLERDVKDAIKLQCLQEQGYLCAYTGLRIEMETSHIEHMWPRSACSKEEQIDYTNLIACFNGTEQAHPGFGARQKDRWPTREERALLIRPTEKHCETCFLYDQDGTIRHSEGINQVAASTTITRLRLDHPNLIQSRRSVLEPLLKIDRLKQLRTRVEQLKQRQNGKLEEYAFIKLKYLEKKLFHLERKLRYAKREG